ncbi:MAG: OBG GTPase family GTP-binding protein [Candidatus Poseidoniales archaeon]|jgi:ribosome-interacting GTPase 1|tara:strand:+ start:4473 stop:5597 length:1125 start_codon:yes stop_codon:yes gene_type:complete
MKDLATIEEQIKSLEDEITKTKSNKATQGHLGKLKAKIAALRERKEKAQAHSKASGGGPGFEVKKSGDASVALVGFPSVGKSSLISQLTEVESDIGNFAFTTLTCIPGLMEHRGAKIQILDLPGLIKGASDGKGRGREILNVIRGSDMVLYVVDPFQDSHFDILDYELWRGGLRLNQNTPQVFITRTNRGGIVVRSTVKQTNLTDVEIQEIVRSFGIVSATVTLRTNVTDDNIVDTLAGNRVYSRAVVVLNKVDLASKKDIQRAKDSLPEGWPVLEVSAKTGQGIDAMKDFIYNNLHFMSIYLKPQGQEADLVEPLIVKDTCTVREVCIKLHRDFVRKFRYARVLGPSAKFDWQRVGLDHTLKDGDLLSVITRR